MVMMLNRYHNIDGRYIETPRFKNLLRVALYKKLKGIVAKSSPEEVNEASVALLKDVFKNIFKEPVTRVGTYKFLRYKVLLAFLKTT